MNKVPARNTVAEVNFLVGIKPEHSFSSPRQCIPQHFLLRTPAKIESGPALLRSLDRCALLLRVHLNGPSQLEYL
jgi:hypothetical protein